MCIARYCMVLYGFIWYFMSINEFDLYGMILNGIVLCCMILYGIEYYGLEKCSKSITMQWNAIVPNPIWYHRTHKIPCNTNTNSYCVIYCHAILFNTLYYHTTPSNIACNTIQHHVIPYNTIQYRPIPYNTLQYHLMQYMMQYSPIAYNIMQSNAISYYTVQHKTTQYTTLQFHAIIDISKQCNLKNNNAT